MEFDEWLKENVSYINACSFEKERLRIAYLGGERYALDNQWISVNDRLPDPNGIKVLMSGMYGTTAGWYFGSFWKDDSDHKYDLQSVTHWMPIPELPK